MVRLTVKDAIACGQPQNGVTIKGWVRTRRDAKGVSFLEINDGSTIQSLQVVADTSSWDSSEAQKITTGSSVTVTGDLVESLGKGQTYELRARELSVIGWADPDKYPLQKKRHSFEFLREIAHLRARTNTFGAVNRVRNAISFGIHRFFQERGFLYVNTPIITASDCEGAGEMFRVTALDLENIPRAGGAVDYGRDFFGRKTGLTVSGQLEAELLATALGKVYTFGPTFRAENSNTSRHLAEFWMIEPEMSFADIHDDIALAAEFLKYICAYCLENCPDDMDFFNTRIRPGIVDSLRSIIDARFEVLGYTEAVKLLEGSGESFEYPVKWGLDLQSEHERWLTEKKLRGPAVIIDYPRQIKSFYMKLNDDEKTVRAMDVLLPGVGEVIGGSERESRYDVLVDRMVESGLNPDDYWWYLDIRRFGTVPHAGFGLGLERTVQFVTGMQNIRDVIPFPRTPQNVEF